MVVSRTAWRIAFAVFCMTLFVATPRYASAAASPEKALEVLAGALQDKDVNAFRSVVNLDALFDASYAERYDGSGDPQIMPFRPQEMDTFIEGIAAGTYARMCTEATQPGCPWYADGLRNAQITKKDSVSAYAAIDNAKNIRTWLVLHRTGRVWKVTAAPRRQQDAETYATAAFLKSLTRYRKAFDASRKRYERQVVQYNKDIAAVEKKAASLLGSVQIGSISFAIDDNPHGAALVVSAIVTNRLGKPIRLARVVVKAEDGQGNVVRELEFTSPGGFIQPGKRASFEWTTSLRSDKEKNTARRLARNDTTVTARAKAILWGTDNLLIDEKGGKLRPERPRW